MNAVIVQQVMVLDPRTLPGYLVELSRYARAIYHVLHGSKLTANDAPSNPPYMATHDVKIDPTQLLTPEGPKPDGASPAYSDLLALEQYNRIISATALGGALYPTALGLLERLNIIE